MAARQQPRGSTTPEPPSEQEARPDSESSPSPEPAPVPLPWYRRRTTLAAAVTCVLIATLGTLSALPGDVPGRGKEAGAATSGRTTGTPETATAPASSKPSASPSLSPSPTSSRTTPHSPGAGEKSRTSSQAPSGLPLAWTANSQVWALHCMHDYVIDKPPAQVDLDKDRPIAHSVAGNDAGTPIPAVRMPYRVSAEDPEVLLVTARTESCDCDWYLELDWSSQGRTGTVRIDDHGRPFRTSGIKGLPRYWYGSNGSERQWVPYT